MITFLTVHQSVLIIMHWAKMIDDPFSVDAEELVVKKEHNLYKNYHLYRWFISNAIETGELSAHRKQIKKKNMDRILDAVSVPIDLRDAFLQSDLRYDYWINYKDLQSFMEREMPVQIEYSHSRDALARAAWLLAKKNNALESESGLFDYLAQIAEDFEQDGASPKLGDTTLKGCAREIFSAGEEMEKSPKS